jgi:transposase
VRIEGSNAYHWVFHSTEAVVHQASPTRGAVVAREMMDEHRPAVWISDRYTAQQGHAATHPASPISPAMSPTSSK